jgi:hypothetical protein
MSIDVALVLFKPQIADSMLKLYSAYADLIAAEIASGGPHAARSSGVKYMRGVKRSVLRLVEVRGALGVCARVWTCVCGCARVCVRAHGGGGARVYAPVCV